MVWITVHQIPSSSFFPHQEHLFYNIVLTFSFFESYSTSHRNESGFNIKGYQLLGIHAYFLSRRCPETKLLASSLSAFWELKFERDVENVVHLHCEQILAFLLSLVRAPALYRWWLSACLESFSFQCWYILNFDTCEQDIWLCSVLGWNPTF